MHELTLKYLRCNLHTGNHTFIYLGNACDTINKNAQIKQVCVTIGTDLYIADIVSYQKAATPKGNEKDIYNV